MIIWKHCVSKDTRIFYIKKIPKLQYANEVIAKSKKLAQWTFSLVGNSFRHHDRTCRWLNVFQLNLVALFPFCGAIFILWRNFRFGAPFPFFGAVSVLWRCYRFVALFPFCGAISVLLRHFRFGVPFPVNGAITVSWRHHRSISISWRHLFCENISVLRRHFQIIFFKWIFFFGFSSLLSSYKWT